MEKGNHIIYSAPAKEEYSKGYEPYSYHAGGTLGFTPVKRVYRVNLGRWNYGTYGVAAHELGHAMQTSKSIRALDNVYSSGIKFNNKYPIKTLTIGFGSYRSEDQKKQRTADILGQVLTGVQTVPYLANLAIETDASVKGYKLLRDAGILKRKTKDLAKRLGPFGGLPTYAATALAPAASYYGARYLPEKIQELYHRFKSKQQED